MSHKLWGGRFSGTCDPKLEKLNSSIYLDKRMYAEDIVASQAYARSLNTVDLLTDEEVASICNGLDAVRLEWNSGRFVIKNEDEDIHTANERRLKEIIGEAATKLHVGRSRNDQVVTDMKLWLRIAIGKLTETLKTLIKAMVIKSQDKIDVLMPGYTHLQRAQPIRWSHWILSHAWSLKNDVDKLHDISKRINVMPLGSGAIAGNPFDIDRSIIAYSLGFENVTQNSMQSVSDRDFVAEFLFWASLVGIHMSRLAEDLIIFSTREFNFVTIDDSFSTGSSLMPQKRNPDSLELIRGIGGSLYGECTGFMMVLKGLPTTYNKDLQSDKEAMFSTFDKLKSIIKVATGTIETLKVNSKQCYEALSYDMLATDLAYYLVRKKVPFRKAHHIAGEVVAISEKLNIAVQNLSLEKLQSISSHFDEDVAKIWNYENSVEQYQAVGGTSKSSVSNQIGLLTSWLSLSFNNQF